MDEHAFRYRARVAVQKNEDGVVARKEVVTDLKTMVLDLVKCYRGKRGLLPERIIVYRDGVGEGQFKDVKVQEVEAIKKACKQMSPKYKPQVTFIVVQKRHHTRFQPLHDGEPVNRNVPPGTTVTDVVTHPGGLQLLPLQPPRPARYEQACALPRSLQRLP
ncbi:hypothetical protein MTO96_037325 [Rhipicephalus appendiculatus]